MEGWESGGKYSIVEADSQPGRTAVFKSPRPFNSTPLSACCPLLLTHTNTAREEEREPENYPFERNALEVETWVQ